MNEYLICADGEPLVGPVCLADSFWKRFRGLMGRKSLDEGEGLLLLRCGSIHCCFMRFSIDVVYLDREFRVLAVETVHPWRLGHFVPQAKHVLELREGAAQPLRIGQKLTMKEWGEHNG